MTTQNLEQSYSGRLERCLVNLATRLQAHLESHLQGVKRIDRVTCRAKAVGSFLSKAARLVENGTRKYGDPIEDIQDQIGARIVVYFSSDIEMVVDKVRSFYSAIEERRVISDSPKEFGYEGRHFVLFVPVDVFADNMASADRPTVFELQVKTLFQHAWAEAEHDLGYKPDSDLEAHDKRLLAFTAAQSWGADRIFQELHEGRSN